MKVEELVYGFKGNETYLTLFLSKVEVEGFDRLQNRAGVYMVYDKNDVLMYVGETTGVKRRVKEHLSFKFGKKELNKDTIGYVLYTYLDEDRYERGVIEGLLVHKYHPTLNCNDEMKGESLTKVEKAVQYDALYYARNTEIKSFVIAKALNVDYDYIKCIRVRGTLSHVELPSGYSPKVVITQKFIDDNSQITRTRISQTTFNQVRELLEEGSMRQVEISRKYNISSSAVNFIKNLSTPKFKKMEEIRTNKAVA